MFKKGSQPLTSTFDHSSNHDDTFVWLVESGESVDNGFLHPGVTPIMFFFSWVWHFWGMIPHKLYRKWYPTKKNNTGYPTHEVSYHVKKTGVTPGYFWPSLNDNFSFSPKCKWSDDSGPNYSGFYSGSAVQPFFQDIFFNLYFIYFVSFWFLYFKFLFWAFVLYGYIFYTSTVQTPLASLTHSKTLPQLPS